MSFMQPQYTHEDFHVGESRDGSTVAVPADVWGTLDRFVTECRIVRDAEIVSGGWWCQLSASGYLDSTDWDGPHPTLAAARRAIAEMWDVDPDTGDDLSDDSDDEPTEVRQ